MRLVLIPLPLDHYPALLPFVLAAFRTSILTYGLDVPGRPRDFSLHLCLASPHAQA
jgi:hypothetical protein